MSDITIGTAAYAKVILHAVKYPHCAVNGVLLADSSKIRDAGAKNRDLDIVDAIPLFHHSHNLSPMAEIALTQIEGVAQADNRVIAGYYAACENFRDNTVDKCPSLKIAEKIVEHFPSATFVVVDNRKIVLNVVTSAIKFHKYSEGKWKPHETKGVFKSPYALETITHLLQNSVHKELIDFDNYLDDLSQDYTNIGIDRLIATIEASNEDKDEDEPSKDYYYER